MFKFDLILASLLVILLYFMCMSSSHEEEIKNQTKSHLDEITLYQNLFKIKRKEQLAIVQKLILTKDVAKLASFLQVTFDKIIEVSNYRKTTILRTPVLTLNSVPSGWF